MPQRAFSIFAPCVIDENANLWSVMYALMESEKADDAILWVLQRLVTFCPEVRTLPVTQTIFSDKGLSEEIVYDVFGPGVTSLLCRFHQSLNLAHNLSKYQNYNEVMHCLYSSMLIVPPVGGLHQNQAHLRPRCECI